MTKRKAGRPLKKLPLNIEQIEILAGFGLTDEEIARTLGVCRDTIATRKKRDLKLREALQSGKAKADMNVIKGLYTRATQGNDTTAAIFWLKNRQPDRWRDRREMGLTGPEAGDPVELKIEVVHTKQDPGGKG